MKGYNTARQRYYYEISKLFAKTSDHARHMQDFQSTKDVNEVQRNGYRYANTSFRPLSTARNSFLCPLMTLCIIIVHYKLLS